MPGTNINYYVKSGTVIQAVDCYTWVGYLFAYHYEQIDNDMLIELGRSNLREHDDDYYFG